MGIVQDKMGWWILGLVVLIVILLFMAKQFRPDGGGATEGFLKVLFPGN